MGLTALQEKAGVLGAAVGEYRGATTAVRFSDPQAEFGALRSGCGVYDLGYRVKISLTGADRVRWLNGMVTNNIRDLAVGQGIYAFLLNPRLPVYLFVAVQLFALHLPAFSQFLHNLFVS